MHNLLAVVVSYGGSPQLHCLLAALAGLAGCRVTLVENRPGTEHEGLPAGVEVCQGHGNVGYGTAVNIALLRSMDPGADHASDPDAPDPDAPDPDASNSGYLNSGVSDSGVSVPGAASRPRTPPPGWLLVVNSDVTVPATTRDMLPELLDAVPAEADVVGFPVRTENGQPGRGSAVLPNSRTNAYMAVRGEAAAVARWPELRYPIGAFFAIRTQTFLRLGGFDPSFWMYYEETDLFARLHAAGGRIAWLDDDWHVTHVGGATVGRAGLMYAELGRSAAIYARRHREALGRGWPAVHAAQLAVLAVRKLATGRTHDALRALRILSGLATGLVQPRWEPAARSRWRAAPAAARRRLGRIEPPAPPLPGPAAEPGATPVRVPAGHH